MKIIAHYLPQFHAIPENDLWWGNGYTEWTAVKKAKPLFHNHYQPRVPLGGNYYDLSNIEAMEWQAQIAKEYGIYGFCFWHYWFDGKLLLETPSINMLNRGTPNFPFCFAWASEPWTRAWYGQNNVILMDQKYGDKESWRKHYNYLLNFFRDKRYIMIESKPVFLILDSRDIGPCQQIMDYWNDLSIKDGFAGIYFITILSGRLIDKRPIEFNAQLYWEPGYTINHGLSSFWGIKRRINAIIKRLINNSRLPVCYVENIINYDEVYQNIINRVPPGNIPTVPGAYTNWDNSPRSGYSSSVHVGSSPKKFEQYLTRQIEKCKDTKTGMLFLNAWNEWGEGAYLEPDEKYGFGYLEAVRKALERNSSLPMSPPQE